jgi:hypothetical protein
MAKICWSESRVVRLRVRTRLGLLPRLCAFIEPSFVRQFQDQRARRQLAHAQTPLAAADQIFLKLVAVLIRKSAQTAQDVQQARFLHQIVNLHEPRKAFNFAEDVANHIDRMRRCLVRDWIDLITRRWDILLTSRWSF